MEMKKDMYWENAKEYLRPIRKEKNRAKIHEWYFTEEKRWMANKK